MAKVYLIKKENTNEIIRWEGSLMDFIRKNIEDFTYPNFIGDGTRRSLAHTRQRDSFYRGYKVIFYGEEHPNLIEEECNTAKCISINEPIKVGDMFKLKEGAIVIMGQPKLLSIKRNRGNDTFNTSNGVYDKDFILENFNKILISESIECVYENEKPKPQSGEAWISQPKKRNVLVIGDLHLPFALKTALDFTKKAYRDNNITDVIFIGDILDNHYTGYHEADPDGYSANDELIYAKREVQKWAKAFPNATMVLGNHDILAQRKAFTGGISKNWIKTIDEVLDIPWIVKDSLTIGNFFFCHGDGQAVKSRAVDLSMSVVQGHYHSKFSCEMISANRKNITYAIQTGCLVDHNAFAMAYGKRGKAMARGLIVIKDIEGDVEIKMIPMPVELLDD